MSNAIAVSGSPHEGYDLVGAAGIWDTRPLQFSAALDAMQVLDDLEMPEGEEPDFEKVLQSLTDEQLTAMTTLAEFQELPPYPYLQLFHNRKPPAKDRPEYRFSAALTTTPDELLIPVDEQADADMLHLTIEANRVIVEDAPVKRDPVIYDPASENNPPIPTKTIRALLYKGVQPIGFHPPTIEAVHRFVAQCGIEWNPESLTNIAGIDQDFYHFETQVPASEVSLTIGGEVHTTTVSALVAAGLRAALCETIRGARTVPILRALKEDPELLARFQQAVLEGDPSPWCAALEPSTPIRPEIEQ